ncbi:protein-L-isoaspartate O-methyltransferase [Hylemonella gracilis str. Niagara R]|uniref:Protein-L-isoaspartate O-methyltransferase n=2 Tax=Hylemonella gracilis TaxID=80880 RepID=A0A016XH27_9BURK|nr:protein-L-isoaspartate O-methyltransferase [Hylemonella gracilis str. Niagara R]
MPGANLARTVESAPLPPQSTSVHAGRSGRPLASHGLDSQAVRQAMVRKLAAQGIHDARVLDAMGRVERHRFVDTALAPQAYEDTSLPIGLGQTISKPNVVARMIELLLDCPALAEVTVRSAQENERSGGTSPGAVQGAGRVLEIGTGCGYQAAVLACVAREVYSIERLRGLHEKARENLRGLRLPNVHLLFGDGMAGYPAGAPYAGIIAAAGGEALPQTWVDQLAVGGRLVAPVMVEDAQMSGLAPGQGRSVRQALMVLDKTAAGVRQTLLEPVQFVPLKSGIA